MIPLITESIKASPDFNTIHPKTFGASGEKDRFYGSYFHFFDYKDFLKESNANMNALKLREDEAREITRDFGEDKYVRMKKLLSDKKKINRTIKVANKLVYENQNGTIFELDKIKSKHNVSEVFIKDSDKITLTSNFMKVRDLKVHIFNSSNLLIKNLKLENIINDAVSIHNTNGVIFKDSFISKASGAALYLSNVENIQSSNLTVSKSYYVLDCNSCKNVDLRLNSSDNNFLTKNNEGIMMVKQGPRNAVRLTK
jgi:glucan-binding YG repeat protein